MSVEYVEILSWWWKSDLHILQDSWATLTILRREHVPLLTATANGEETHAREQLAWACRPAAGL